jgi:hypothetical protein
MLKQKHVDASREIRLWTVQVIIPSIIVGTMVYERCPELRNWFATRTEKAKAQVNNLKQKVTK